MNILFFGTPLFAKIILESLLKNDNFNILGLVTQIDKPFGRKKELKAPQTKELLQSIKSEIPIYQPTNFDDLDFIYNLNPDIILVVAYGKIIPKQIIDNFYCINIHTSILPQSRGASPIQDMILKDQNLVGISIIKMSEKLDDGDILGIRYMQNPRVDIEIMTKILSKHSASFIVKILGTLDYIKPLGQINADSSYCKKIEKNDGIVIFDDAKKIYLKYLAYKTWPNIFLKNGTKIFDIELDSVDSKNLAGKILLIDEDSIIVGCKKGTLLIKTLQDVGKNKISAPSYLRGKRLKSGDFLIDG